MNDFIKRLKTELKKGNNKISISKKEAETVINMYNRTVELLSDFKTE